MPVHNVNHCFKLGGYLFHARCDRANVNFRIEAGGFFVLLCNDDPEGLDAIGADEIHRASAESPTGHAGAVNAIEAGSNLHHNVEFTAAYLVIVAEAAVGL